MGLSNVKDTEGFDFSKEMKSNKKTFDAFKADVEKLYKSIPNNVYAKAVHLFYTKYGLSVIAEMTKDSLWKDLIKDLKANITFCIQGVGGYAASDRDVVQYKKNTRVNNNKEAVCLGTGEKAQPVSTTYSTFILGGKSNARLVSFQINSGYDSYGKQQGMNAPISEEAEFKYTTALLHMFSKGSHNKIVLGGRTFIFWSSSTSEVAKKAEDGLYALLGIQDDKKEDPNVKAENVKKVFHAIYTGSLQTSSDDQFYILGLAPNAARISVVYWA